jgi:phenolic acid decarboxylase
MKTILIITIALLPACTQVKRDSFNSFLTKSDVTRASGDGWTYEAYNLDETKGAKEIVSGIVSGLTVVEGAKTLRNTTNQAASVAKRLSDNSTKVDLGAQAVEKAKNAGELSNEALKITTEGAQ